MARAEEDKNIRCPSRDKILLLFLSLVGEKLLYFEKRVLLQQMLQFIDSVAFLSLLPVNNHYKTETAIFILLIVCEVSIL